MRSLSLLTLCFLGCAHAPVEASGTEQSPRRTVPRPLAVRVQLLDVTPPEGLDVAQFVRAQLSQAGHGIHADAAEVADVVLGPPAWRGAESCLPVVVRLTRADGATRLLPVEWTGSVCGRPSGAHGLGVVGAVLPDVGRLAVGTAALAVDAAKGEGAFAMRPGAPDVDRRALEGLLAQGLTRVSLAARDSVSTQP